jgi:NADH dehydrogenase FAD-containing subunit
VEGKGILGGFDQSLRQYTEEKFRRDRVAVRTGANVVEVLPHAVRLAGGEVLDFGLCVWNTGIAPNVGWDGREMKVDRWGHLVTDRWMRVLPGAGKEGGGGGSGGGDSGAPQPQPQPEKPVPGVFALGDASSVEGVGYAATAQVAEQQGRWLGRALNAAAAPSKKSPFAPFALPPSHPPFEYRHRGSLAFLGSFRAISDFTAVARGPLHGQRVKGFLAFLVWRSAYLTRLGSWRNRVQVPFDWVRTFLFGRDTTLF